MLKSLSQSYLSDVTTDPLFPACLGLLKVDHEGQLRFRHRLARDVYVGGGVDPSHRTTELDQTLIFLLLSANLHMKGSTESTQFRGLIQRPTQSVSFLMYMFLDFASWLLARLNTGPKRMLLIARAFLENNMVTWTTFLSNAGAHVLRQACEDLLKYCEKFSNSTKLSQAEGAALQFVLNFLETWPLHLAVESTRRQWRGDFSAKVVPGGLSAGHRNAQGEYVQSARSLPKSRTRRPDSDLKDERAGMLLTNAELMDALQLPRHDTLR